MMLLNITFDGQKEVFLPPIKPETFGDLKKQVISAFPDASIINWHSNVVPCHYVIDEIKAQDSKSPSFFDLKHQLES